MVRDSRARRPRDYTLEGQWPCAVLEDRHVARVAQAAARSLAQGMRQREMSANRLARLSAVNRQTIANVLAGEVWPDLVTIADLEEHLDWPLWPVRRTPQDLGADRDGEQQRE